VAHPQVQPAFDIHLQGIRKLSSSIAEGKERRGRGLFTSLFSTDELISLTSDAAWVQAMLDTESRCHLTGEVGSFRVSSDRDRRSLPGTASTLSSSVAWPAPRQPGRPVGRSPARRGRPLAAQWCIGPTSQDILDTAAVLVSRSATAAIDRSLRDLADGCAALAQLTATP